MIDLLKEYAGQAPGIAAILVVVVLFIKYIRSRDTMAAQRGS